MDAIDGVEEGEALRAVSVGEDTFVRVWSVGQKDITSRKGDKKEVKPWLARNEFINKFVVHPIIFIYTEEGYNNLMDFSKFTSLLINGDFM